MRGDALCVVCHVRALQAGNPLPEQEMSVWNLDSEFARLQLRPSLDEGILLLFLAE